MIYNLFVFSCSIIAHSFLEKAELEQQLKPFVKESDYEDLIGSSWDALIETGFSFVITDKSNRLVGVSLSFDANCEPEIECTGPHTVIFEFLDVVEGPIRFVLVAQFQH